MKLNLACYFPAEKPTYFTVNIDEIEPVSALLEAVWEKLRTWGQDVQLLDLCLYKTDIPTMPSEDRCTRALQWLHEQPLQAHLEITARLTTLFPAAPSLDTIHILVADPSVMELLDTLGEPDAQYIRKVQKALHKAFTETSPVNSPSEVVKTSKSVNTFLDPDKGRVYLDRVPVAMFSAPLAALQRKFDSLDSLEVSQIDVEHAATLLGQAITFYENEDLRQSAISGMVDLLAGQPGGKWDSAIDWCDNIRPDTSWWHEDFFTMLSEIKNTLGVSGDAILQATAVYSKLISRERFKQYRGTCNFPVVLVGLTGARIQVSAAVYAGTIYVSNLFVLDLASGFHSSQNAIRLARVFKALSSCRKDLQTYYDGVLNPPDARPQLSALYPNPTLTSGVKPPSLTYRKFLARTGQPTSEIPKLGNTMTAMYLATLNDTSEEVIVKFTSRYNEEAHTLLANAGRAPKLHCCEHIVGDLFMVVMECVVGETIWQLYKGNPGIPTTVVDQVEKAVNLLHTKDIVFGDLRDNNILYTEKDGKVFLVDFDWPDKDGIGRYPGTLNLNGQWAEHVRPYSLMQKADDTWQLVRLRARCAPDSP